MFSRFSLRPSSSSFVATARYASRSAQVASVPAPAPPPPAASAASTSDQQDEPSIYTNLLAITSERTGRGELWRPFLPNAVMRPSGLSRQNVVRNPRRRRVSPVGLFGSEAKYHDPFVQLDIDPRYECQNRTLMSHFVTEMGKIPGRETTRLSHRSQRYLTKAIKRAKMMGIIPILSKHTPQSDDTLGGRPDSSDGIPSKART